MTSHDAASALLEKLCSLGERARFDAPAEQQRFSVDFDSNVTFPDVPFDLAHPSARYDENSRPGILRILDDAASAIGGGAPRVLAFVNEQMQHVLFRRSAALAGASSSSNRQLVGYCLLANMHLPPDAKFVCMEALAHEAIHQYLYRMEAQDGNLCDLSDDQTFRSPWSGNRIPLHSLVHASFVYFGLLQLWHGIARYLTEPAAAAIVRERSGRILFGYAFLHDVMHAPGFPLNRVEPRIVQLIDHIARGTSEGWAATDAGSTLRNSVNRWEGGAWTGRLAASLNRVATTWR